MSKHASKKGPRKCGSAEKELKENFGGFYDVASFRQELPDAAITDEQINALIQEDRPNVGDPNTLMGHRIVDAQREAREAQQLAREAQQQARSAQQQAVAAQSNKPNVEVRYVEPSFGPSYSDLAYERNRRRLAEAALFPPFSTSTTAKFIEKERLKDEIKREMGQTKPRVIVRVVKQAAKKKAPAKKKTTKKKAPAKKKK